MSEVRRRPGGGGSHADDCPCSLCVGYTSGPNGTGVLLGRMTHGARSVVQIHGRAGEVADGIIEALVAEQLWRESFAPTVQACAIVLVRLERAHAALAEVDERSDERGGALSAYLAQGEGDDPLARLRQDAVRWANTARGYLNDLGLTPSSLARIAKHAGIARSTRANTALRALDEHVRGNAA